MPDETHDPALRSWVASANDATGDFPIQNLPFGRFRRRGQHEPWRIGVAIGDRVLDLRAVLERRADTGDDATQAPVELAPSLGLLAAGDLNGFMALGRDARRELRTWLSGVLRGGSAAARELGPCLVAQADAELTVPCRIGGYTDFYTGIHHATAVGKLFRPDNPLLPNYHWVPIGYHGRTSSIGASGQAFPRPRGQLKGAGDAPEYAACRRLDYELELGALVGPGNAPGETIAMDDAEAHLFGLVLLNDWSARDIQAWEYQPLGPFLAKNFATTVSPWIVTMEALEPYRTRFVRPDGAPAPLPHLASDANAAKGAFDLVLEVWLQTASMRSRGEPAVRLMRSSFKDAYWTLAQLVVHHASNGCNLEPGDLLGTGTQSGADPGQGGSLLELSNGGKTPIALPNGETRTFLADGDTVILRAHAGGEGRVRIGFGDCAGTVLPAR
jgi:fumarylacetoacetase